MPATDQRVAPGPPGHWLLGHIPEFKRDVLGLMMASVQSHGDVVRFRLGPHILHLANHPDHVEHVLQTHSDNYDKRTRSAAFIKAVTGESLLTSNGASWQRQRRMLQPAFHRQHIASFAARMTEATARLLDHWQRFAGTGRPLDVASEMMGLTYTIVGRTLFSTDVGPDANTIERAMQVILPHTFGQLGSVVPIPDWIPTPANRRFREALRAIDGVVYRIIREHRSAHGNEAGGGDLLDLLLGARDEATGQGLTDEQLRNETLTFLLAGHETTANALTWTFHLLGRHPEVEEQLRHELAGALGGRTPTIEDLSRLPILKMVIRESMRLYPPIWIIERRVIADDFVGGFHLPAGSAVVISPYALHRHPEFWEDPELFRPERFEQRPPPAYIPFGAGPRFCIGSEFALLEAQIILAMIVQAVRLRPVHGHPVEPFPGITLRARYGLLMTIE
jgi:enediyne biosynthesis protein E7